MLAETLTLRGEGHRLLSDSAMEQTSILEYDEVLNQTEPVRLRGGDRCIGQSGGQLAIANVNSKYNSSL